MSCPQCQSNNLIRKPSGPHIGEYCGDCGAHIRWVPQSIENFIWPIGAKHKGKRILDILKTDRPYLQWAADTISTPGLKKRAQEALQYNLTHQTTPLPQNRPVQSTQALPKRPLPPTLRPPSSDDRAPWE